MDGVLMKVTLVNDRDVPSTVKALQELNGVVVKVEKVKSLPGTSRVVYIETSIEPILTEC